MKELEILRGLKKETENIDFSYKSVLRIMHLIHQTKDLLSVTAPIPNKEIALHQVTKIIESDINKVIYCKTETEIKEAFNDLLKAFAVVLNYFT